MDRHTTITPASAQAGAAGWVRLSARGVDVPTTISYPLSSRGGGHSRQMCTPTSGTGFEESGGGGGGVRLGCFTLRQFPCEKGTKMVKSWRWGSFACTAAPLHGCSPASPFSGYSLKCIYIYIKNKKKLNFLYIYLSIHPTEAGCPRARLRSCRPVVKRF